MVTWVLGYMGTLCTKSHHKKEEKKDKARRERVLTKSMLGNKTEIGQFRWGRWFSFMKFTLKKQFPC